MEENSNVASTEAPVKRSNKSDWKILSGILAIVVIALLIYMFIGKGITGQVISEAEANTKVIEYLNSRTGGGVESVSTKDIGNLYEVTVSYQGNDIPVYITKDGGYFVQGAIPLTGDVTDNTDTETQTPTEVPKSDKPVAEAFIFSYCPYGLQFEKALQPVYDLLKNKADIKIVAIGAMHGEYEKTETLRQICIEKNYGRDKLFSYLKDFNENTQISSCSGQDACVNPLVEKIMSTKGIDKTKINNCMKTDAEALYQDQNDRAAELDISGSPTFVINGVQVNVGRNAEAIKKAICDAFNTAPSECSKTLSTTSASAGFGSGASSGSSATC
ncbi:MAG: disulfide isomerase DsbC N-terminal domain-containing protein [Candidatus Nanoarchaeia archaeon]|nr:disulfide isomerase DsbC N-terminal domain-containing protein [Candidatus Nanoarchaeia archaeon]